MQLDLVFLNVSVMPSDALLGVCELGRTLGSLSANGYGCVPTLLVVQYESSAYSVKVKVTQSCLTFCDDMDYTVHGIPQARILEWVAFPFSRGFSQPRDRTQVSHIVDGLFTG